MHSFLDSRGRRGRVSSRWERDVIGVGSWGQGDGFPWVEKGRQKLPEETSRAPQFPISNPFSNWSSRDPKLCGSTQACLPGERLGFQSDYVPCSLFLVKLSVPDAETHSFKSVWVCLRVLFNTVFWGYDHPFEIRDYFQSPNCKKAEVTQETVCI